MKESRSDRFATFVRLGEVLSGQRAVEGHAQVRTVEPWVNVTVNYLPFDVAGEGNVKLQFAVNVS